MSVDLDRIKDRIRKLTTLGGDAGAFEQEAENALRFARKLMLDHNLTEGDLDAHERAAQAERIEYGRESAYSAGRHLTGWECALARAVALLIGTIKYYKQSNVEQRTPQGTLAFGSDGRRQMKAAITFYGPAEDVRDAVSIFAEWSLTIAAMARLNFGGALRGDGRAYCDGFVDGLAEKLRRVGVDERKTIADGGSTALVLTGQRSMMQAKQERAIEWLRKECGVSLRAGRGAIRSNGGGAYGRGQAAGRASNMSRSRTLRLGGAS